MDDRSREHWVDLLTTASGESKGCLAASLNTDSNIQLYICCRDHIQYIQILGEHCWIPWSLGGHWAPTAVLFPASKAELLWFVPLSVPRPAGCRAPVYKYVACILPSSCPFRNEKFSTSNPETHDPTCHQQSRPLWPARPHQARIRSRSFRMSGSDNGQVRLTPTYRRFGKD